MSACTTAQDTEAAGLIATACAYEPAVTGVVAASGNATAVSTQSFATAFCRSPTISAESAQWLAGVQNSAAAQVGMPLAIPGAKPAP